MLLLASPLTDVSLSLWAGGAISTQSPSGSNPTKRNWPLAAIEIGKCYLKNDLNYLGWKTMMAILGHSSTCQSRKDCHPPSLSLLHRRLLVFLPLSIRHTPFLPVTKKGIFLSDCHFHLALLTVPSCMLVI